MGFGSTVLGCTGAGMGLWAPLGAVISLGFWALLIGGGLMLARRSGLLDRTSGAAKTLAERYAAGDIDDDEYKQRLDTLNSRPDSVRAQA